MVPYLPRLPSALRFILANSAKNRSISVCIFGAKNFDHLFPSRENFCRFEKVLTVTSGDQLTTYCVVGCGEVTSMDSYHNCIFIEKFFDVDKIKLMGRERDVWKKIADESAHLRMQLGKGIRFRKLS